MEWIDIKNAVPDEQYDYQAMNAKKFLVADGSGRVGVAWYAQDLEKFGANGAIYANVTHWCEIPTLPVKKTGMCIKKNKGKLCDSNPK